MTLTTIECGKPGCTALGEKTYTGTHDNRIRVCPAHYWALVTGEPVSGLDLDLSGDVGRQSTRDWFQDDFEIRQGGTGGLVESRSDLRVERGER